MRLKKQRVSKMNSQINFYKNNGKLNKMRFNQL